MMWIIILIVAIILAVTHTIAYISGQLKQIGKSLDRIQGIIHKLNELKRRAND